MLKSYRRFLKTLIFRDSIKAFKISNLFSWFLQQKKSGDFSGALSSVLRSRSSGSGHTLGEADPRHEAGVDGRVQAGLRACTSVPASAAALGISIHLTLGKKLKVNFTKL